MSVTKSLQVRSNTSANRALEVELTHESDRFFTTLRLWVGSQSTTLLRSIEGDSQEAWPPSPVIQDPMIQEGPSGAFLAGVGMAGKNHWSVAIDPLPNQAAFEFDYACRVKDEPKWLGSSYKILNADPHLDSINCLKLDVGDAVIRCEPLTDRSECRVVEEPAQFSIVSDLEPASQLPRTIRWKYRFSVLS